MPQGVHRKVVLIPTTTLGNVSPNGGAAETVTKQNFLYVSGYLTADLTGSPLKLQDIAFVKK